MTPQHSSPVSAADIVERLRGLANLDEYANSHYDKLHYPLLREAAAEIERLRRPAQRTSIAEFTDAELRSELHRRAQDFLGDPTKGVSFPADWEQDKAETSRLPRLSTVTSTDSGLPDDNRCTEDMTLAHNARQVAIEECAQLIESGAGMADLIDQEELDQQAKYIRALSTVTRPDGNTP